MGNKVYNFSAGPSLIDHSVLGIAAEEMCNYEGSGLSVMELSHRGEAFQNILANAEASLRRLMGISDEYVVLFLQGGATTQFAMIPMNLMTKHKKAAYVDTGVWSAKAISYAKKFGNVDVVASSENEKFSSIPDFSANLASDYDYFHMTWNNTIYGTHYKSIPKTSIPLVAGHVLLFSI